MSTFGSILLFAFLFVIIGVLIALVVLAARQKPNCTCPPPDLTPITIGITPTTDVAASKQTLRVRRLGPRDIGPIPLIGFSNPNMQFTPTNAPLLYTLLAERMSDTVVRRSVDLEAATFSIVPLTGEMLSDRNFAFYMDVPSELAGPGFALDNDLYWTTSIVSEPDVSTTTPGVLILVTMAPSPHAGFVRFTLSYSMVSHFVTNQSIQVNFRIVYFYDANE